MIASLFRDPDEPVGQEHLPHLSHSRVNRYLTCPEQYRLYYIERLRPKLPPATLAFGQIVHQSLAELFQRKADPVKSFTDSWAMLKGFPLGFNHRESWEKLKGTGEALVRKFISEEFPKLSQFAAVEEPFSFKITGLDLPFVGIIDLVARIDGKRTVVDWKTAGSAPGGHEAAMSDQLTAYKLARPEAEQLALCFLVKTKKAQIEWHCVKRTDEQVTDYLAKVGYTATEITAGRFYRRTGMWCAWCDYLPVCSGNRRKAAETLMQIG